MASEFGEVFIVRTIMIKTTTTASAYEILADARSKHQVDLEGSRFAKDEKMPSQYYIHEGSILHGYFPIPSVPSCPCFWLEEER